MTRHAIVFTLIVAAGFAGCAPSSPIGLVDTQRIVQNWSQYQGYQAELMLEEQTISQSRASAGEKQREYQQLQQRYGKIEQQLVAELQGAAQQVAKARGLKLVFTRQGVGWGGVDITPDVEKALNITESATPAASPS